MVVGGSPDIQNAGVRMRLQAVHENLKHILPHADKEAVNVRFQTERKVVIVSCHLAPLLYNPGRVLLLYCQLTTTKMYVQLFLNCV